MDKEPSPSDSRGYTAKQCRSLLDDLQKLRNAGPGVQMDLAHLAQHLTVERARTFANQALGRRLPVVRRCVENIYRIFPPDRQQFLSQDECSDVAIQLHAFAINVCALFDNIAWVCVLEIGATVPPLKIGLYKAECQPYLPATLIEYLNEPTALAWYRTYGKLYRDSTAHRIAPYLPQRAYTTEEGESWRELDARSMLALREAATTADHGKRMLMLDEHERLREQKESIGSNSLIVALSLTGEDASPLVYLHPQLLCDLGLAHELVGTFAAALRAIRGWPVPVIPAMTVG